MPVIISPFPWFIWPLLFVFFFGWRRHRRWENRWESRWEREPREDPALRRELDDQRAYIATLEDRLAEMETRLDFTERLLVGRRDTPAESPSAARVG